MVVTLYSFFVLIDILFFVFYFVEIVFWGFRRYLNDFCFIFIVFVFCSIVYVCLVYFYKLISFFRYGFVEIFFCDWVLLGFCVRKRFEFGMFYRG